MPVPITHHAIERCIERVPGCVSAEQAVSILTSGMIDLAVRFAGERLCMVRIPTGNRVVISNGVIKTVLPPKKQRRPKRWELYT